MDQSCQGSNPARKGGFNNIMHPAYSGGETISQGILRKSDLNALPTHISFLRENTDCGMRLKGIKNENAEGKRNFDIEDREEVFAALENGVEDQLCLHVRRVGNRRPT
jgi:hypothetical protein